MKNPENGDLLLSRLQQAEIPYALKEVMARHTTFAIGGEARCFVSPQNDKQLLETVTLARECDVPYVVLGRGSNVLFSDAGFNGVVISTLALRGLTSLEEDNTTDGTPRILAECGVSLRELALFAAARGWQGLEFAHGIPGTLGGAVRMNAGAYGGNIGDWIDAVCCYNPVTNQMEVIRGKELAFAYRHSFLTDRPDLICLSATLVLPQASTEDDDLAARCERIQKTMDEMRQRRRDTQPLNYPSAGSVFKRPQGHFAGKLIEDCHLKGTRVGGAEVSEKHAGFIVNRGGATAEDVRALIHLIKKTVWNTYGVALEEEILYIDNKTNG